MESWDPVDATGSGTKWLGFVYEKPGIGDWTKGPGGSKEALFDGMEFDQGAFGTGNLAESWEFTDPQTFIIHVRKGVYFQNKPPVNGRELTAADLVYTYDRINKSPTARTPSRDIVKSITAIDKYTVKVEMPRPSAILIDRLIFSSTGCLINPREMVEKYGNLKDWRNACGTGPFTLDDVVPGYGATYRRNPNYWGYDELNPQNRLPYVDTLRFFIIADLSTQMAALRTGKIDYLADLAESDANNLKRTNPELEWHDYPRGSNLPVVAWRADEPPFSDLKVRRAMFMAVNWREWVDDYMGGKGIYPDYPISPDYPSSYTPFEELPQDIKELFVYNPEKAKQLLAEAGYPNGFTTDYTTDSRVEEGSIILIGYWKKIGVNANLRLLDTTAARALRQPVSYHGMNALIASVVDPVLMVNRYAGKSENNWSNWFDPTYDQMVGKINITSDPIERAALLKEANLYFLRDAPQLRMPMPTVSAIWWPWLHHFWGIRYLGGAQDYGAIHARMWVDQDLKKSMGQ